MGNLKSHESFRPFKKGGGRDENSNSNLSRVCVCGGGGGGEQGSVEGIDS